MGVSTHWGSAYCSTIWANTWSHTLSNTWISTKYINIGLMVCIPHFGLYARYDEIGILTNSSWFLSTNSDI